MAHIQLAPPPAGPPAPHRARRWPSWQIALIGLAVVSLVAAIAVSLTAIGGPDSPSGEAPQPGTAGPTPGAQPSGAPSAGAVACPAATVTVSNADALTQALDSAAPGTVIAMRDGTYPGNFAAESAGTAGKPIFLCGGSGAVLSGLTLKKDYVLHLREASYWRLLGFTVTGAQKGVVVDSSDDVVIQGLTVTDVGMEGIHLRSGSSDNLVAGNAVRNTGLVNKKYGEGIYVGSAESNWCDYSSCGPDTSDRNIIRDNTISATASESVDIKEGTTGGQLIANSFDGAGMTGADSWVDIKGNDWLIQGNTGANAPLDGYQTHEIVKGWGTGNTFRSNDSQVDADGYAINATKPLSNVVSCTNTQNGAKRGLTNVSCT